MEPRECSVSGTEDASSHVFRGICLWPDTVAPAETPVQAFPRCIQSPHNQPLGHKCCSARHPTDRYSYMLTAYLVFFVIILSNVHIYSYFTSYVVHYLGMKWRVYLKVVWQKKLLCYSVTVFYSHIGLTWVTQDRIGLHSVKVFLRLKSNKKKDIWENTDWDLRSLIYFQSSYKNRINLYVHS